MNLYIKWNKEKHGHSCNKRKTIWFSGVGVKRDGVKIYFELFCSLTETKFKLLIFVTDRILSFFFQQSPNQNIHLHEHWFTSHLKSYKQK